MSGKDITLTHAVDRDKGKCKIAICFFGITRSLTYTIDSIEKNILLPSRQLGEVRVFSHFFNPGKIVNPRSGENGNYVENEYELLKSDWLEIEEPEKCLDACEYDTFKSFGDRWGDDFKSLRNLIHQLHSLENVTNAALRWDADIYIFCRPDLMYHDSLSGVINKIKREKASIAYLPTWQSKGKRLNDRFSICGGSEAAVAYGKRITKALEYCHENSSSLQPESLVYYSFKKDFVPVRLISAKASRVRVDGSMVVEDFSSRRVKQLKEGVMRFIRYLSPGEKDIMVRW